MSHSIESPGSHLRRLRAQRRLTLKQAATPMGLSTSSLSRLERGERAVERYDLEAAVAAYELSAWEAHQLYTLCGIPPNMLHVDSIVEALRVTANYIKGTIVPAVGLDQFGYTVIWNGPFQAVWPTTTDQITHSLDSVFTPEIRQAMGEHWRAHALSALRLFNARSIGADQNPEYRAGIGGVAERLGEEFISLWNEAVALPGTTIGSMTDPLGIKTEIATQAGRICYALCVLTSHVVAPLDIYLFIPYSVEDYDLHRSLVAGLPEGEVYCSMPWVEPTGFDTTGFASSPLSGAS